MLVSCLSGMSLAVAWKRPGCLKCIPLLAFADVIGRECNSSLGKKECVDMCAW